MPEHKGSAFDRTAEELAYWLGQVDSWDEAFLIIVFEDDRVIETHVWQT